MPVKEFLDIKTSSNNALILPTTLVFYPTIAKQPELSIKDFKVEQLGQIKQLLNGLESKGLFYSEDVRLAIDKLRSAHESEEGYTIKIAESNGVILGFISYGKAELSEKFYDLDWIAVSQNERGKGIGRKLIEEMESDLKKRGVRTIIVETSSREEYNLTRYFYEKLGYKLISVIKDYYKDKDDKLIYRKDLI